MMGVVLHTSSRQCLVGSVHYLLARVIELILLKWQVAL